jgi:hypothetical protein
MFSGSPNGDRTRVAGVRVGIRIYRNLLIFQVLAIISKPYCGNFCGKKQGKTRKNQDSLIEIPAKIPAKITGIIS